MEALRIGVCAVLGFCLLGIGGASWECAGEAVGDKAKNWYRLFGFGCTVVGALSWALV